MLNRGKKGLALLLSTVFAVAAVAGAFPVVTFAQDEPTQAVVVQQEGEAAPADLPAEEPWPEEEAAPEPTEPEEPAGEPETDPAALPQGEALKEMIRTLLAATRDMAALSEEELDQTAQEIEALAVAPVSADEAGDEELTELFSRLGDAQAAAANGVAFVPILPGREADSWRRLQEEALPKLLHGTFSPAYQAELLAALRSALHG